MGTTHTVATLEVSATAYDDIAGKMRAAGYDHAFLEPGNGDHAIIDMVGIGLERGPTPDYVALRKAERDARAEIVKRVVKVGDVLTHSGCGGCIREHEFIGWDGNWMRGRPTRDTFRMENMDGRRQDKCHEADDIGPGNVTHINRVPVEAVEFLATKGASS